ncbi:MAG: PucC family protein [Betaproteobacteria bacterium]|nr:PucC family protein [Betaproteobacteria bacterium]
MNPTHRRWVTSWVRLGSRFLPFADAASADLPLSRLLRLSLFQISFGMAVVMLVGTLNRVMIVELKVPAGLVALMVALPLLAAPFRALIGFRSDHHRSELGWRRVPYIWMGTMIQFGGFAIMPFALLVLAGAGQSAQAPAWVGQIGAALAFLMVGAGMHTTQTAGLALATDLAPPQTQPKVVGLMYVMQLVGMMFSALFFGDLLSDYSPGRLIQVIQAAAIMTLVLNVAALWKQESRSRGRGQLQAGESFSQAWQRFTRDAAARRRLWGVGLGTMAFTMQDVLLEPYGGEVLSLSVAHTTFLTATLALGGLIGFGIASRVLGRGADPCRMAMMGAWVGLPAFALVIAAAPAQSAALFVAGAFFIGLGGGLFAHGTLTATMQNAAKEEVGLALGAWGSVQATAAGLAMALGGLMRQVLSEPLGLTAAYTSVYGLELILLAATVAAMAPLARNRAPATGIPTPGQSHPVRQIPGP